MIDVFRTGVSIGMVNQISPAIGAIQRNLLGLGRVVDGATSGLRAMRLAAMGTRAGGVGPRWLGMAPLSRQAAGVGTIAATPPTASRGVPGAFGRVGGRERRRLTDEATRGVMTPMLPLLVRNNVVGVTMIRANGRRAPVATAVPGKRSRPDAPLARLASLARETRALAAGPVSAAGRGAPMAGVVAAWPATGVWPMRSPLPLRAGGSELLAGLMARAVPPETSVPGKLGAAAKRLVGSVWVRPALGADPRMPFDGVASGLRALGQPGLGEARLAAVPARRPAVRDAGLGIGCWPTVERAAADLRGGEAREPRHVIVLNAHDIGNATGTAVHRGLRAAATMTPSLPSPAAMPWAPGPMPTLSCLR